MARLKFSAIISDAAGKVGDVVFSKWKGIAYVRRRVTPSNPQSGAQQKQRYLLTTALTLYQSVKALLADAWDTAASGYAISGYNQFMDQCMGSLAPQFTAGGVGEDPTWATPAATVLSPYNSAYPALLDVTPKAAAPTALGFTWTARDGAGANNKVRIYWRESETAAWQYGDPILESAETGDTGTLENETEYEYAIVPYNDSTSVFGQSSHDVESTIT